MFTLLFSPDINTVLVKMAKDKQLKLHAWINLMSILRYTGSSRVNMTIANTEYQDAFIILFECYLISNIEYLDASSVLSWYWSMTEHKT